MYTHFWKRMEQKIDKAGEGCAADWSILDVGE